MESTYRIIPRGGASTVEKIAADGARKLIDTWPTEAAVSHMRTLQQRARAIAELATRRAADSSGRD
jgi:hypothetical protein